MSRRVISQAEAHETARQLRALRRFVFRAFDRKAEEVGHRYWHLGDMELGQYEHGIYNGMQEMARGTEMGVALLGAIEHIGGKPLVRVYAFAMPHHDEPEAP
jgi:hypothetical protein